MASKPSPGGQSVMEYAVLLGVVTAALLGMQVYAKRSIQASVMMAADQIGDQANGMQYESGERTGRSFAAAGTTLARESSVTTATDRTLQTGARTGGGHDTAVVSDTTTSTGALAAQGASVSFYSDVIIERQQ